MGYHIHHSRALPIFHHKDVSGSGEIVEMRAWEVPRSAAKPEGIKYSMVYIDASGCRILGYDNAEGKGNHRHFGDTETPLEFENLGSLVRRFLDEVSRLRGRPQ